MCQTQVTSESGVLRWVGGWGGSGGGDGCRLIGERAVTSILMNCSVTALIYSSAIMRDSLLCSGTYHLVVTHILELWINDFVKSTKARCSRELLC